MIRNQVKILRRDFTGGNCTPLSTPVQEASVNETGVKRHSKVSNG